ncbi:MAG: acyltransferase [Bacteroidetes bacterium]|nr:acyltransferase [Bacteroidota bacterium]
MRSPALTYGTPARRLVDYFHFMYLGLANHIFNKIPSYFIRKMIYRYLYRMKIGRHSNIQMNVRVYAPWKISIGDNCSIGHDSLLDGRRGIRIGNNVDLAGYVRIFTLGHDLDDPAYKTTGKPVVVEDEASIFTGAYILPGITVAKGSAIALGAVLTKSTEPWAIYGGNPAKKIKNRNITGLTYNRNYKRYFH